MLRWRVSLAVGAPCGGGLAQDVLLGEPSAIRRRPVDIRVKSEDAFNSLDKFVKLLLAPARVGRMVDGRSLNRQCSELGDNSLWRRRLDKSIQRLAASIRGLACNQAMQLFNFALLSDPFSDAMDVLELVV
jgi:hypothetical protein